MRGAATSWRVYLVEARRCIWVVPLVESTDWADLDQAPLGSFQDAVGNGGGIDRGTDVVCSDDVGAGEDGGYVGGGGGVETVFRRRTVIKERGERGSLGEGVGEEAFAGGSGEKRKVELAELIEMGEERVVFAFAEAEAGVEHDLVAWNACGGGGFEACFEFGEDEGEDFVGCEGWEREPVLGATPGVHEDCAAVEVGAGGGHVGVPEVAADVVDDLASGFDGMASCAGVEGVDGEDGFGALFEDGGDDGEDAGLFFAGRERGGVWSS